MGETQPLLVAQSVSLSDDDQTVDANHLSYFSDVPNFLWIELSLLINVFLSGFDGTVAASTFATIGNEFRAISLASWITSSYLITLTAFQPLYGSISDLLGRKCCIIFALSVFIMGSYGCFLSNSMTALIILRGITGIGGGGLMSLSTITNSDIIHSEKRALFQAVQNLLNGLGAVSGASFGGYLTSILGWRWCFAIQIAPALVSVVVTVLFIGKSESRHETGGNLWRKIDFTGAATLVGSLTSQLLILSLGGNKLAWLDWRIMSLSVFMVLSTLAFFEVETTTLALPIIPVKDYKIKFAGFSIALSFCVGLAAYSYLFTLPLLFQINLGDSITKSGLRLTIPSLSTPIGGIATGLLMAKSTKYLPNLPIVGTLLMAMGNFAALFISKGVPNWAINLLLVPANIGQGVAYPSSLFLFIYFFESSKQALSTSTVYLMRNIGGVWGVTYISSVTLFVLRKLLTADLAQLDFLSKKESAAIIANILESTDTIKTLDPRVRQVVVLDYTYALRVSQTVSGVFCLVALVCYCVNKRLFIKGSKQWN